jgi:hypothetical protein
LLRLEDLKKDASIDGLAQGQVVRIVTTEWAGPDAVTVYFKTPDGVLNERMLLRADEATLSLAAVGRPWSFDANGEDFKLGAEAYRINLAHLFDPMMAVHTSNVEPLPHQITAVYESMLPRQPLRFVLADDPGAGKTIMAGLLIRELLMRADARRILIVAPGSLVEQWQDEMREKFGTEFKIFGRDLIENSASGNPFEEADLMVVHQPLDLVDHGLRFADAVIAPEFPLRAEGACKGATPRHIRDGDANTQRHIDVFFPFQQRPIRIDGFEVLDCWRRWRGDDALTIVEGQALDAATAFQPTILIDGPHEISEDFLALAANDDINPRRF